ncbi:MAG TPA: hypothetical protein VMW43_10080 [Bacteroidota bacterium]|nr:hypothetical protein [Bacteroidota bacterium]
MNTAAIERHHIWCASVIILLAATAAWSQRFVQDDAFISFRYAENLLNGQGFVWNAGERVEGYSNFLWTLLIAGGMAAGFDPVGWSELLGILSFAGSMAFTYAIIRRITSSSVVALVAIAALAWNFSFRSFATGGLETQFQTCLFIAMGYLLLRLLNDPFPGHRALLAFSALGSAAILTRLDSVLICIVFETGLAMRLIRSGRSAPEITSRLAALAAPKIILILPWLLWKQAYYGDILPNTFYLKMPGSALRYFSQGAAYLGRFILSYWTIPLLLAGIFGIRRFFTRPDRFLQLIGVSIICWTLYLLLIGGDFMEFRMIVPILPFMVILTVWLLGTSIPWKPVKIGIIALLLAGSVYHEQRFEYRQAEGIEPVGQLRGHLEREDENWAGIGKMLDTLFRHDRSVTIATTAAGAIPYFSKLPTIDMLGVNEPWIARFGIPASDIPGHQRISPLSYLLRRRVNLVLSHPLVLPVDEPVKYSLIVPVDCGTPRDSVRIMELPLGGKYKLVLWYLTPHPAIDTLISCGRCTAYPVAMR